MKRVTLARRDRGPRPAPGAEPRLTPEEERELLHRARGGDAAAAARLVASQMRFVRRIAWRYRRFGQPFGDLVQEGVVGVMEALKRFNPERDVRLATYAVWWIRASIQEHVVRSYSLVRIGTTATQKTLFFRLAGTRRRLGDDEAVPGDAVRELAARFGVTAHEIAALARRMTQRDHSLDLVPHAMPPDPRPTPEEEVAQAQVRRLLGRALPRALALLPPRERLIIERRFFADDGKATRDTLGAELGLSKERIRQLEMRALSQLRRMIEAAGCGRAAIT